jgi:hypothetical protein
MEVVMDGDEGHCEVTERSTFDFTPIHPLTPIFLRLKITDQIKELGKDIDQFRVTIVPILAGGSHISDNKPVRLDSISIVGYNIWFLFSSLVLFYDAIISLTLNFTQQYDYRMVSTMQVIIA